MTDSAPPPAEDRSTRIRRVAMQFARFLVVGGVSFAFDYGLFLLLHEAFGVQYLIASTTSFTLSLAVNYVLTVRYVFGAREGRNVTAEILMYVALNMVALGLNQLILYVSVDVFGAEPALGKLIATAVVLVFNFISRKLLIERVALPRRRGPRPIEPGGTS